MKKTLIMLATITMAIGVSAQVATDQTSLQQWIRNHQQRDASQTLRNPDFKLVEPTATTKASDNAEMPNDRTWLPGEWEELQAVVVTPYYYYTSPDGNKYAEPLLSGIADYYNTPTSQNPSGHGPYMSHLDTTNASGIGDISFYLMDAIQSAGVQAWVRVENADDTAAVLRKLANMGLHHDALRFFVASGNSFWYRDCGPICFYYGDNDSIGMLDFEYYPGRALDDSLPDYMSSHFGIPVFHSTLEWEGGNCLADGAGAMFTSNKIYIANNDTYGQITWDGQDYNSIGYTTKQRLTQPEVRQQLSDLVGQRALHVMPRFRYDGGTGHIDLYTDMSDENIFVVNKMPTNYNIWTDYRILTGIIDSIFSYQSIFGSPYSMTRIPFPSNNSGSNFGSQEIYTLYTRTYANHLLVNGTIIVPCFSPTDSLHMPTATWDRENVEQMKASYPGYNFYCINVSEFDGLGGSIHCITKQIPADNPIRILHKDLRDTLAIGDMQGVPVSAVITNRSGIAAADLVWHEVGSEWDTLHLDVHGNRYCGAIPRSYTAVPQHSIEYYISATSNNGKTITKPITANQGGYYSFTYTDNGTVNSTLFDFDTINMPIENITFRMKAPANNGIATVMPKTDNRIGAFHPNPATDKTDIAVDLPEETSLTIHIYDLGGREVHTSHMTSVGNTMLSVNASRLPQGMYTVVFDCEGTHVARKLIVK